MVSATTNTFCSFSQNTTATAEQKTFYYILSVHGFLIAVLNIYLLYQLWRKRNRSTIYDRFVWHLAVVNTLIGMQCILYASGHFFELSRYWSGTPYIMTGSFKLVITSSSFMFVAFALVQLRAVAFPFAAYRNRPGLTALTVWTLACTISASLTYLRESYPCSQTYIYAKYTELAMIACACMTVISVYIAILSYICRRDQNMQKGSFPLPLVKPVKLKASSSRASILNDQSESTNQPLYPPPTRPTAKRLSVLSHKGSDASDNVSNASKVFAPPRDINNAMRRLGKPTAVTLCVTALFIVCTVPYLCVYIHCMVQNKRCGLSRSYVNGIFLTSRALIDPLLHLYRYRRSTPTTRESSRVMEITHDKAGTATRSTAMV